MPDDDRPGDRGGGGGQQHQGRGGALPPQRGDADGPVLAPAQHEVRDRRARDGGGRGTGEPQPDGHQGHEGVLPSHEQQQRGSDQHRGERLGVGHHEDGRGGVEAPQDPGHQRQPLAGRLGGRVHGEVQALPHQDRAGRPEEEVEQHRSDAEGQPGQHQDADQHRERRVERPRAVGQQPRVGVCRQRHRIAVLGDPSVPDTVPAGEDVADGRVEVAHPRGRLEPRRGHRHGDEHDDARDGIPEEQEDDRAAQRPPRHGAATLRGQQRRDAAEAGDGGHGGKSEGGW